MRLAEIFPRLGGRTLVYEGGAPAVAPVVVVPRTGSGITVDSENGLRAPVVRRAKPALLAAVAALAVTTAVVAFFVVKNRSGSGEPGQQTTLTAAQTAGDVRSAGAAPAPPSTGVRALVAAEEEAADLVRRAQHALETGDVQRARELASDAVRRAPASAEGWLTLGAAHEALGDGAAARAAYTSCKEQALGDRVRECAALLDR